MARRLQVFKVVHILMTKCFERRVKATHDARKCVLGRRFSLFRALCERLLRVHAVLVRKRVRFCVLVRACVCLCVRACACV